MVGSKVYLGDNVFVEYVNDCFRLTVEEDNGKVLSSIDLIFPVFQNFLGYATILNNLMHYRGQEH